MENLLFEYLIIALILSILLVLIFDRFGKTKHPEDSETHKALKSQCDDILREKDALKGKATELEKQNSRYEARLDQKSTEINNLEKRIGLFETTVDQQKKEFEAKIADLENSRKAFEDEKKRVTEDDQQARKEDETNRDRVWALHEDQAKARMREVCQKSSISLPIFDNTNLPGGFDPKLKPDFMVQLLGQYVIFDSKTSKARNLQIYLANQAKKTAKKIRESSSYPSIYKTVFFVIPSIGLLDIKEIYYLEDGLSFYVIPVEAFEPIVRTLKRLEEYELAEKYDPQEREDIVNLVASFDHHIRLQNATNVLCTLRGLQVLSEEETMPEDLIRRVTSRRERLRIPRMSETQLRKLIENPTEQIKEVVGLITPKKPGITSDDLDDAQNLDTTG